MKESAAELKQLFGRYSEAVRRKRKGFSGDAEKLSVGGKNECIEKRNAVEGHGRK